jgi:hypothetical protein
LIGFFDNHQERRHIMRKRMLSCGVPLALALLVLGKCEVAAQQARSFVQLQVLVKQDDTVTVTERGGTVTKGRIVAVTDSSLLLRARGVLRDLSETDVVEIRQRRSDSLTNGAKYGAIAGGAFGILGALLVSGDCIGCGVAVAGMYTAMGAGIGAGIDALIVRQKTIFTINRISSNRISLRPLLSPNGNGLTLSFSF